MSTCSLTKRVHQIGDLAAGSVPQALLGGSGVTSRAISTLDRFITTDTLPRSLLTGAHEPPRGSL